MMDAQNGVWLVPTRGRVHDKLPRFLAACAKTGMTTPGRLLLNRQDYQANQASYDALDLGKNWHFAIYEEDTTAGKTESALREVLPYVEWVGWLGDDSVPETPGWDVLTINALTGWNFVSTNDGMLAPKKMHGACAWSGALVRAVGSIFVPGSNHFYMDDMWEELGRMTGCWTIHMDIMVRHRNAGFEGKNDATTSEVNTYWPNDERAFAKWKKNDLLGTVDRVVKMMESSGVDLGKAPDLTGISVMIGTPCGSGQYERLYVHGLINTMNMLKQFGAEVVHGEIPYVSDVALARNMVFGMFLRSNCTHLMFIDDDMGWQAQDVVRLLLAKKDFVAVAGPRKVYPPSYAVNVSDEHGRAAPVQMDEETGFLTGRYVGIGMAFTLLTHEGVERMADAYKDLTFVAASGREEIGVFTPMVTNRRYLSEDFAYCHRWHQIGGKIFVASDVALQHVGSHVWEGSWLNQLEAKMKSERAAA
jgi:hypothetical protein